ncbi:hypothetical protein Pelo_3374 [Pelomyxa schiedti]|nr:hypothetical protein Pelo_3374 [Pelomyxa schiedti]
MARRDSGVEHHLVLHLKGSTKGLGAVPAAVAEQIQADDVAAVVWDGDSYATGSFTSALVPAIAAGKVLVAFLLPRSVGRFVKSWAGLLRDLGYDCPTCSPDDYGGRAADVRIRFVVAEPAQVEARRRTKRCSEWAALGCYALDTTGASRVVCWGGGAVAREERSLFPRIQWLQF